MITLKKLQLVKKIIMQVIVYQIISISGRYKMIVIDISKQHALDADPKTIQRIYFTGNLHRTAIIFFIIE